MAAINDLLNTSNNSTGAQSAQMNNGTPSNNPIGDFINTLVKYAQPTLNQIENSPIGLAMQGKFNQVPNALTQLAQGKIDNKPYNPQMMVGGEMELVPGEGAALPFKVNSIENNPPVNTQYAGEGLENGSPLKPINNATSSVPPIAKAPGPISTTQRPPMITKAQADPQAIANYNSIFDVPRRIAQNQTVKPETVINQLIDDGITNVKSINDLESKAANITGHAGAFPMINNYILKSIKTPIDYTDAQNFKNINLPKVLEGEKPGFINEVNNEINKAMQPLNYTKPGELPDSLPENHAYATDLFQTSQNLRDIASMYKRKAYTDMGELNNPEMERAANAITELKNNIDNVIDKNVPSSTYESFKSDPNVQAQLQRVPPKVAQRWLQGATRFKDGQTIQAPYVNLANMIEDTKDTQMSVWTKAAKAMQNQNASSDIGQAVGENIPGPKILKNIIGGTAAKVASPFVDQSPEAVTQDLTSGKTGGGKGSPLKNIAIGAGVTGGLIAGANGLSSLQPNSNADSNPGTNNSNGNHNSTIAGTPLSVNSIPTKMSDITPDPKTGNYNVIDPRTTTGGDGNSLAMTDGQHQTAIAALDNLVKEDPSYITNPIKAGQLAAAKDAINTKYSSSQKLMDSYTRVSTISQKIADATQLLKKTSPILTDKIGFLEGGHEMFDPNYQSLVNDLNFIENSDPRLKGQLSNLATTNSVKTALANAAKLELSEYNQLLKSYGAGSSQMGNTQTNSTSPQSQSQIGQQQTPSQMPYGLPAPVNGALPPINNNSYQFTPPNPMFQ